MTDEHFPFVSENMQQITQQYVANNHDRISHVVFLGDGIDNPGMSVFPEKPDHPTRLQDELDMLVDHIHNYHELAPHAKLLYCHGNHDVGRLESTKSLNRSMASLRSLQFKNLMKESALEQGYRLPVSFADSHRVGPFYFVHGDPRIDPYIKGGVTGTRRTAEMHPEEGNIVMGHQHRVVTHPRPKGDASVHVVGAMFDTNKIAQQYKSYHGYQNGFMVISYSDKFNWYQVENFTVPHKSGLYIDGEWYSAN